MADSENIGSVQQDVKNAFGALLKQLNDAYWVASTIDDKDRLRGLAEIVSDVLVKLDIEDIKSRTNEFNALSQKVNDLKGRLNKLRDEIDTIVHSVNVAASVTSTIAEALAQAAKFFV